MPAPPTVPRFPSRQVSLVGTADVEYRPGGGAEQRRTPSRGDSRRSLSLALPLGLCLLAAPLAARDLPLAVKPWSYIDGKIEATHVPSGLPVTGGHVSALLFPEGYHGKPASVVVTLSGMRWPDPARRPYLPSIYTHMIPWIPIGEDGRFTTDRMSLSPPFGGSYHWEPARLEGRVTEWGKVLQGSFESPLVRGTFEARGLPQSEARALERRRRIERQRERWMRQNR